MRLFPRLLVALSGCVALALVPLSLSEPSPDPPEEIYHNGVVLTMDDTRPRAEAVAVAGGRIVAVGQDDEVLELREGRSRVVDLGGRAVLPGFIDSHAHWVGDGSRVGHTPDTATAAAVRAGWTSVTEMYVDEERLEELRMLDAAGRLPVRVNAYLPVNFGDEKFGPWYLDFEPGREYSERLRLAGIKLFLDHDWGTAFHWDQAELDEYVLTAHARGWQVAAHAVSAEGVDQILTAMANAQSESPHPSARHRVEHVIQLRDDQLLRMRELGLIASVQPGIPGDLAEETGFPELVARGETRWIARWRDLVDGGVRTIGGTDFPWLVLGLYGQPTAPPHGSPLEAMHQAVTRESYSGRPPEEWELAQRLTVDQALRLFTVDAAYGTFEENVKGTLAPGKYADLIILSDDPTTVPPDSLTDIQVLATVVGGRVEYCADHALC